MKTKQLTADFIYCEKIIKKHSKSFYYAFSSLPVEKRNAVYAIYAFCRIADDSVDEKTTKTEKKIALEQLHRELDQFSQHQELNHPLWRALRHVFNEFDMDIQAFYDQLIGQETDINFSSPRNLQELEQYSYYVAGSVGHMLLPIIASENQENLKSAAVDLGIAMQITNILRDIGEDFYEKNRVYLPEEERLRFGYSQDKLCNGVIDDSFIALFEHLAKRAEQLYDNFEFFVDQFDRDSQIPVSVSAKVYRGILDVIRNNDYDCLTQRNFVARVEMERMNA